MVDETSFKLMLCNLLENATLHDVLLEGVDGVRVGASRAVLGARSVVFEKTLFGGFVETTSTVVKLGYPGSVVQALVEYIHTDTASILEVETGKVASLQDKFVHIKTLVLVAKAANYYNLSGLGQRVLQWFKTNFKLDATSAFALVAALDRDDPSAPNELRALAFDVVRSNIAGLDEKDAETVGLIGSSSMKEILEDSNVKADELQIFNMLQLWVNSDKERTTRASELSKLIHFDWIDPVALSTTVATSGFVSIEQLAEAYKIQAVTASKHSNVSFKKLRSLPAWETPDLEKSCYIVAAKSKTQETVVCLEHCPIKSGSCRWVFEVVKSASSIWMGMNGKKLQDKPTFWGFNNKGEVISGSKYGPRTLLRFKTGSKVTFKLNLASDDEGKGTLSASVDGDVYHQLIRNLRNEIDRDFDGFVPEVGIIPPACIKLLDFKLDP